MKRIASLFLVSFLVVFLTANLATAKGVPITTENISQLKGTWVGTRCLSISNSPQRCLPTSLDINNDSSPLEGALILHVGTQSISFKNGVIDERGRLSIEWNGTTWILLTLQTNGELKGECRFKQGPNDLKGGITLKKK